MAEQEKEEEDKEQNNNNRPVFTSAREMIPVEHLERLQKNLVCGYNKITDCKLLVRDKSHYACIFHQAMKAIGTDFFMYYEALLGNENDLSRMTSEQHTMIEQRRTYMKKWMDNFPRGAIP